MKKLIAQHSKFIKEIVKQNGSFEMQTVLEKTFFASTKDCALIIQNINRYAVLFCEDTIYNEAEKHNAFTSSFWELVALIKYLKDNEYIYSLGGILTNEKLCAIHPDFHSPKIQGDRIILNDKGWYSRHPDSIFDKNGALVLKGSVYRNSYYETALQNLTGVYILSEKSKELLNKRDEIHNKAPSKKGIIKPNHSISNLNSLLLILLSVFHIYLNYQLSNHIKKNDTLLSKLKLNENLETKPKITNLKPTKKSKTILPKKHYGIDISHYQGNILKQGLNDSISFVICKATEGENFIDSKFKSNWAYLKNKNILRGAYHFYKSNDNPIKQANHFLETLNHNGYVSDNISPIVDVEALSLPVSANIDVMTFNKNLLIFLNHINNKTSKKTIIYTNVSFANKYLKDKKISKHPLWIADYTDRNKPETPNLWKGEGYKIWQKVNNYHVNSSVMDLDEYQGSLKDLTN